MNAIYSSLSMAGAGMITALATLLVGLVPRLWVWLGAKIHGERVLLLRQTLDNRAVVTAAQMLEQGWGVEQAVWELMAYVRDKSLPETVKLLKLTDSALLEMARAAFYRAVEAQVREPRK